MKIYIKSLIKVSNKSSFSFMFNELFLMNKYVKRNTKFNKHV